MSRKEETTDKNVFKEARLKAAETNDNLKTLESACEILHITREKLGQIEQDDPRKKRIDPDREDVIAMIDAYKAPELRSYYCGKICPLGVDRVPVLDCNDFYSISFRLGVTLNQLDELLGDFGRILKDGKIDKKEKEQFTNILTSLKEFATQVGNLDLWAEKNVTEDS